MFVKKSELKFKINQFKFNVFQLLFKKKKIYMNSFFPSIKIDDPVSWVEK